MNGLERLRSIEKNSEIVSDSGIGSKMFWKKLGWRVAGVGAVILAVAWILWYICFHGRN